MSTSNATAVFRDFLVARGASFESDSEFVSDFGDIDLEIAALNQGSGLVHLSSATTLFHDGPDALDLLHRLSTNDQLGLELDRSVFTVLTSERGRIVDLLNVARVADNRLLLLSESNSAQATVDWIDRFTIIEDAELRDVTSDYVRFALIGPAAAQIAESSFGAILSPGDVAELPAPFDGAFAVASGWSDLMRIDVACPVAVAESAWNTLIESGATPAGETAFHAARIARGIPHSGTELTEDANPLEAGLKDLVSFTKGCYIGQEVVARLDTYDKLQKRLVRLEADAGLRSGAALTSDGKRAGIVTSVSPVPATDRSNALGFARRGHWDEGTKLECDGVSVMVRDLPGTAPFG